MGPLPGPGIQGGLDQGCDTPIGSETLDSFRRKGAWRYLERKQAFTFYQEFLSRALERVREEAGRDERMGDWIGGQEGAVLPWVKEGTAS